MLTYDNEGRYIVYIDYASLNDRRAGLFQFSIPSENFCLVENEPLYAKNGISGFQPGRTQIRLHSDKR